MTTGCSVTGQSVVGQREATPLDVSTTSMASETSTRSPLMQERDQATGAHGRHRTAAATRAPR
jgi:hypothetical protein